MTKRTMHGEVKIRRAKRADAAASAAPMMGPGSTQKNSVTTAVTNTTPLSSALIGLSKPGAGSSKYMTLTTLT